MDAVLDAFNAVIQTRESCSSANIVITAGQRSFGGQALPPSTSLDPEANFVLDITQLQQDSSSSLILCPATPADLQTQCRRVQVPASWSLEKMLKHANSVFHAEQDSLTAATMKKKSESLFPFNTPTSHWITIGGAIATNGHSRMSTVNAGFWVDQLRWFRLVSPNGTIYKCSPQAERGSLEHDLFYAVPGSYGALGVLLDVEIVLRVLPTRSVVHIEVVEKSDNTKAMCVAFADLLKKNCEMAPFRLDAGSFIRPSTGTTKLGESLHDNGNLNDYWDQGICLLIFGNPKHANSVIVAHRLGYDGDGTMFDNKPPLALCNSSDTSNSYLQAFGNRFPKFAMWLQDRTFTAKAQFKTDYYHWLFFQNSHDYAHRHLHSNWPIPTLLRSVVGVHPDLPVGHQTWLIPETIEYCGRHLHSFTMLVGDLLESDKYSGILEWCEFQDALYAPPTSTNLMLRSRAADSKMDSGGSGGVPDGQHGWYIYTISISLARIKSVPGFADTVKQFFEDITATSDIFGCKLHLLKQTWCRDDALLRSMHRAYLDNLLRLKKKVDPHHILHSDMMDRLLC